ncbi:hypothetical protein ABT126_11245 [Streptomyces sp. NPDC002012]|uniref:hypothetical protein n=1 Tax=Streptomyces sp. NPDC002012 TaxID=3154532 RepID=UPI0033191166
MAATTGRDAFPAAGAEKPSLEPVLTFRALPASRARDRWAAGVGSPARAAGPDARPCSRSGLILRTRTGVAGAEGEGVVMGVLARVASTTRWTAAGAGAEPPVRAGVWDERTGISAGAFTGFGIGSAGAEGGGATGSPADVTACCGPVVPACVRRRSPSSGASFWSRAVEGSEGRGVPIPPRARACDPNPSGCGGCEDRACGERASGDRASGAEGWRTEGWRTEGWRTDGWRTDG